MKLLRPRHKLDKQKAKRDSKPRPVLPVDLSPRLWKVLSLPKQTQNRMSLKSRQNPESAYPLPSAGRSTISLISALILNISRLFLRICARRCCYSRSTSITNKLVLAAENKNNNNVQQQHRLRAKAKRSQPVMMKLAISMMISWLHCHRIFAMS